MKKMKKPKGGKGMKGKQAAMESPKGAAKGNFPNFTKGGGFPAKGKKAKKGARHKSKKASA